MEHLVVFVGDLGRSGSPRFVCWRQLKQRLDTALKGVNFAWDSVCGCPCLLACTKSAGYRSSTRPQRPAVRPCSQVRFHARVVGEGAVALNMHKSCGATDSPIESVRLSQVRASTP